jgi:SAM-dependent methyltransferase
MDKSKVKEIVKEAYGKVVKDQKGCGSCGPNPKSFAKSIGYSDEELNKIPEESNLALSCGNPTALAGLKNGETVLDLGSGAGFDCFLAASKVGQNGKIIGVDMTPEMIEKAKNNARKWKTDNVEFRLGEIENLPVEDSSVDVIISNCVINLSADKLKVYKEAYRVLKRNGRVAVSDIALIKELPKKVKESVKAYVGCVGGAILVDEYINILEKAGFKNAKVIINGSSSCIASETKDPIGRAILDELEGSESLDDYVVSVYVEGRK